MPGESPALPTSSAGTGTLAGPTGTGQTLALVTDRIGKADRPVVVSEHLRASLPADPRRLRVLDAQDEAQS